MRSGIRSWSIAFEMETVKTIRAERCHGLNPGTKPAHGKAGTDKVSTSGTSSIECAVVISRGLGDKLDHLSRLGVNALYLNPIFQAESCHKYNATSYLHVDDRYGIAGGYEQAEKVEDLLDPSTWTWTDSDRLFLDFLKEAKARGFRVIIDGVFNHVGTAHPAFRDVLQNGRESRFADWFDVRNWDPFEYEGWAGFGGLPAFKKNDDGIESQAVRGAHLRHHQTLDGSRRRW